MSTPQTTTAQGTIAVQVWQPEPFDQPAEGPSLVRIHVEEDFEAYYSSAPAADPAIVIPPIRTNKRGSLNQINRLWLNCDAVRLMVHPPLLIVIPPSIMNVPPVTQAASSDARYSTILATSSGFPVRRIA